VRLWRLFKVMMANGTRDYSELLKKSIVRDCPACPQPGINIPDDWKADPQKYAQCLTITVK
jgi:hypothetical protein